MTTTMTVARGALAWLNRRSAPLLLAATTAGLAAGGLARLAGVGGAADLAWLATAACGLGYALWITAESLRHGRLSVAAWRCRPRSPACPRHPRSPGLRSGRCSERAARR